ncbi:MAG: glycosyltransferase [Nitrospinota bacterium]|nr:glycosyltransferase [Nitrospinota bacterium]
MRIGLMTWGSDGDIRPFCALAGGLAAHGHDVTLAVASVDNKDYTSLGDSMGFKVIPACKKMDYSQVEADDLIKRIVGTRNLPSQFIILFREMLEPVMDELFDSATALCAQSDLVIGHAAVYSLFIVAEKQGLASVAVSPIPSLYRSVYTSPEGAPNLGRWINPLFWKIGELGGAWIMGPSINSQREKIGLAPQKSPLREFWENPRLNLICASPSICQRYPDWKDNVQIPGFFNIPDAAERWEIPGDLLSFLDYGEAPVYITFGSFTQFDMDRNVELMADTAKLLNRRSIIQAYWENTTLLPDLDDVYLVRKAPHHQIFPRCAAVVHHGGAGTTQSSLFCGCPSVVVSHAFDQFFWADRLRDIGVGGAPLQKRTITPKKLAAAIETVVQNKEMKERAERLGAAMKEEDGVTKAVELIEKYMAAKG